jgi:3-methyladenine DNA glycosylase AlkD
VLIGPLLQEHPALAARMPAWAAHRNMWVRRAAAVALVPSVRRGLHLNVAYRVAADLHKDRQELIQKAVGWMLREAGKADPVRLEHYLRTHGRVIPRTTIRYAIERFPERIRQDLLRTTGRAGQDPRRVARALPTRWFPS